MLVCGVVIGVVISVASPSGGEREIQDRRLDRIVESVNRVCDGGNSEYLNPDMSDVDKIVFESDSVRMLGVGTEDKTLERGVKCSIESRTVIQSSEGQATVTQSTGGGYFIQ